MCEKGRVGVARADAAQLAPVDVWVERFEGRVGAGEQDGREAGWEGFAGVEARAFPEELVGAEVQDALG